MVEATERLSLESGFEAITVDQIAAAAQVSRRTFFRYFDNKETAFFDAHEIRLAAFCEALAQVRPGEPPYDRCRRCLLDMAAQHDKANLELRARHRVIQGSRALMAYDLGLDGRYTEALIDALTPEHADPTERLRARVLGSALFGVVRAVLRPWLDDPTSGSLSALGAEALSLLEQGVAHSPELALA